MRLGKGCSAAVAQDRNHDDPTDANELDQRKLIGHGSPSGDLDLDLTYEKAGNLRTEERVAGPFPIAWTYTHDAWNRLIEVKVNGDVRAEYEYNGLKMNA